VSTERPTRWPGRRVVIVVYAGVLAVAALMGIVIGVVDPDGLDPTLLFLVDLPATPLGMAVFGVTTIGLALGVLLVAVAVVADRFDDVEA